LLTNWRLERLTRQDPVVDLDLGFFRVLGTRVQRFAYTPPGALYSTPLWCSALDSRCCGNKPGFVCSGTIRWRRNYTGQEL
jgi:hypothetical protein